MLDSNGASGLIRIRPRRTTVQLSRSRTNFVSRDDGTVSKEDAVEGLYVYQTRVLCRYRWLMNGKQPEFSCGSNVDQWSWIGYYVQAPENWKEPQEQECDPLQQTIELRLTRSVGEGLHEDVQLTNHTQIATRVRLELQFEHEFVSREEAKNGRKQHGKLESKWSQVETNAWELVTHYRAERHYSHQGEEGDATFDRGMKLRIENVSSAPGYDTNWISFTADLAPHGTWRACLEWLAYREGERLPFESGCSSTTDSDWERRRTRFLISAASVTAPHAHDLTSTVLRTVRRAKLDLADLRMYDKDTAGGFAVAAGIPTYMTVFGRDLLATSWEAAMLGPELLRGSLNVLGEKPASKINDWRDAQPGRIVHETHTDPTSVLNFRPQQLYFGSASSSYLYPIGVAELWHWTGDLELARRYADVAIRALKWADEYSLDSTGFYRYQTRSEQGLKNQGWKDSSDAIVYPDGSQVETPIGTCEMQAFVYVAKLHFSELLWWLGETELARRFHREAEDLKARFNEKFWMEEEGYFAMGIGPQGELIRSIGSDPGHCLLSGIVEESRIKRVVNRMLMEDLFSGWGVRTLSSEHPAFNPFSYHRGTVWPVENAAFVLAFARYGLHGETHQLAKAIFEAASIFDYDRLPELFGGHQRNRGAPFPGLYTRADWPQAWSASAPFAILQALIGIYPYAPVDILFLDPHLPEWLPEITIENLRVGQGTVTLRFFRTSTGDTDYRIVRLDGTLHIVHQPSPWSLTTGWAERVRDAVMSFKPSHHRKARAS